MAPARLQSPKLYRPWKFREVSIMKTIKNEHISAIVEKLKSVEPYKVILFGSYAYGTPTRDSDIDLLVVTGDDSIPNSYDEKMEIHLKVSAVLREIMKQVPVDLIVYTKPMYRKFVEIGSMFSRELHTKGKILYERADT